MAQDTSLQPLEVAGDVEAARFLEKACQQLQAELGKIIVGQKRVIEEILIAIFARGHCLMQGVPGLAKTLIVSTLARATDLSFRRIQFTPDLMPSDITGTDILQEDPQTGRRQFEFQKGPIFANMLLADEVNRTPPKTQAALLQAMQERQVTVGSRTFDLPDPFFVLATQNPIEQEGTYPLPEAQLDRFMFMVMVNYPQRQEELEMLKRTTGAAAGCVEGGRWPADPAAAGDRAAGAGGRAGVPVCAGHRAGDPAERTGRKRLRETLAELGRRPARGQYMVLAGKARCSCRGGCT